MKKLIFYVKIDIVSLVCRPFTIRKDSIMGKFSKVFESQKENLFLFLVIAVPVVIVMLLGVAIAPFVLSKIAIPFIIGGIIVFVAVCIGIAINLVYKAYCAIRKKK